MSRSYKKVPIVKDGGSGAKYSKRLANRTFRRKSLDEDSISGKSNLYRRFFPQYIHDYVSFYPKSDAIRMWNEEESESSADNRIWLHYKYKTLKDWLNAWRKMMLRK